MNLKERFPRAANWKSIRNRYPATYTETLRDDNRQIYETAYRFYQVNPIFELDTRKRRGFPNERERRQTEERNKPRTPIAIRMKKTNSLKFSDYFNPRHCTFCWKLMSLSFTSQIRGLIIRRV